MKFLPWLQSRAAKQNEKRDGLETQGIGLSNLGAIWSFLDGGNRFNESDEVVNDATALSIATVYTCCRVLSDGISSLPCKVYKQTATGKMEDIDAPLSHLLQIEANPETSAYSFFETLTTHLMLRGNAYAEIQRSTAGDPVALWNLDPRKTEPVRLGLNGDLAYKTWDGMGPGQTRVIAAKDMLHVVLFSWDGIQGVSPVAMLRQTMGLAIGQQKFSARMLRNNAVPAIALTTDSKVKPEDKTKMRADWEDQQLGGNQGRIAILDGGLTVERLGLSAEDSELLSSRSFSRSEIAAAFRVPASMVGDLTRLSNSNHEQQSLSFVQDSLTPILKRIEIEFRRKLLPPAPNGKPNTSFILFDLRERLRGDFASTMAGYATGKQWGFYSTNDVRRELGENPIGPVGDVYWTPVNMQNSELLLDTESVQDQPIGAAPVVSDDAARSSAQYARLYRDAVGRLAARTPDKRDLSTVTQIFEPLVSSIAESKIEAIKQHTWANDWTYEPTKAIAAYLKKLTERSATWTTEELDSISAQELLRVTKTLSLTAHRSVAEHVALKGLPNG
ncbi:MAG: phage portal protein [Acidobacteriales bacterium 59-55]|nr:phage portal protein [Terriglobales bacterium]OJV41599.1 MAG: phage portal protein [Acidobacteriales bacterium 59-55]